MSVGKADLDGLQRRILEVLADFVPRWTLVGGAALVGFHLHHRTTRDLDLFWRGMDALGHIGRECEHRLRAHGLEAAVLQEGATFVRLRVGDGATTTIVDLVADPSSAIEAPDRFQVGPATIDVSAVHDLLVDKLCALLSRSEIRDLIDLRALVDSGADLDRAIDDAPRRDAGFSPLHLTWTIKGLRVDVLGRAAALSDADVEALGRFRDDVVTRLMRRSRPTN